MGIDPHKAWELFTIDPPDFLAMFALVITAVAIFVWWYRGHLVKERIATNEQRVALARDEQAAVTKQIEVLKPQLEEARSQLAKATKALVEKEKSKSAVVSNAIAQLKEAQSNSTLASTTVGMLSEANNALGATLTRSDTPLVLKESAKSKQKD